MRPWLERATAALLALLVAVAVLLGVRLWSLPVAPELPAPGPPPYLGPDAALEVDGGQLLQPLQAAVALADGRHAVLHPGQVELDRFLWPLLAGVAAAVPPTALRPVDEAAVVTWREPGWTWVEVILPVAAPAGEWRRLLQRALGRTPEGPAAGPDRPAVDRLLLAVGPDGPVLAWRHAQGALAYRAADGGPGAGALREAALRLRRTLPLLLEDGGGAERLPERVGSLRVLPGAVVPSGRLELPIAQVRPLPYDRDGLAQSFFADPALVRRVTAAGVTVYADGEASLTLHADGAAEYRRGEVPRQPQAVDRVRALEDVVDFAAQHGGWPEGAVLYALRPLRVGGLWDAGVYGLALAFAPRLAGRPVVQGQPWLAAEWVPGVPGRVAALQRRFLALEAPPDFTLAVVPALDVLRHAAALPAEQLPPEARVVRDVWLGYRVDARSGLLLPAWVVELGDGSRLLYDAFPAGPEPRLLGREAGP